MSHSGTKGWDGSSISVPARNERRRIFRLHWRAAKSCEVKGFRTKNLPNVQTGICIPVKADEKDVIVGRFIGVGGESISLLK